MVIEFKGRYAVFSNFYPAQVEYRGRKFPTSEHAFMSAKSDDEEYKDKLTDPDLKPSEAKKMGREVDLREDWEEIKYDVMEEVLRDKFSKEPFKGILLETGKDNIQEGNYHGDKIWGVDLKQNPNYGENHLGRLLMKIRDEMLED